MHTHQDEQKMLVGLIQQAQQHSPRSRQYRKLFNQIASIIQNSSKLYKNRRLLQGKSESDASDIYAEAFQLTLIYMNRNLHKYDKKRGQVMTWFNAHLTWRIKDVLKERQNLHPPNRIYPTQTQDGKTLDPLANSPSQEMSPELLLEAQGLQEWLCRKFEEHREELEGVSFRSSKNLNAYELLRRFIPMNNETGLKLPTFKELATEFNVEKRQLRRFYRKRCLPYLSQYIREYGWVKLSAPCPAKQQNVFVFMWTPDSKKEDVESKSYS